MINIYASLLIAFIFILTACSPAATTSPTQAATETAVATEAIVEVQPEADECLACHTDKQRLIDTAKPEEESHEAESKGVG